MRCIPACDRGDARWANLVASELVAISGQTDSLQMEDEQNEDRGIRRKLSLYLIRHYSLFIIPTIQHSTTYCTLILIPHKFFLCILQ